MGRPPRIDLGNYLYHIINRANSRQTIFRTTKDYQHFETLLEEAQKKFDMRIVAYTIMPNHWHLFLYPKEEGDLSSFMQWLTLTHTQQYHAKTRTIGYGHIYQGRYKSFIVEKDPYFLTLLKYIERNPVRAKLANRVEDWHWGSGYRRMSGTEKEQQLLSESPVHLPKNYRTWVNTSESKKELESVRASVNKGTPLGTMDWTRRMVDRFGLELTTRSPGRPKNGT
ncbi:MAG: transposase [Patescibacteria group bacterium]